MILQQERPDDYVLATGKTHSIREFLEVAFSHVGLRWEEHAESDPELVRKIDVGRLIGNPSRAQEKLGWTPEVSFEELVRMMVDAQVRKLSP